MSDNAAGKSRFKFETVASIVAMLVGVSALFVAWDQAQIMRKQQHASVVPILNVSGGFSSSEDSHVMTVELRNNGIGPALIQSARLTVGGHEIKDWPDLRDRFLPKALHDHFRSSLDTTIGVLAAGERAQAIRFTWSRSPAIDADFEKLKSNVFSNGANAAVFSVCYCSVFDRCWRSGEGESSKPQPVKKCNDAGEDVVARLLQTISDESD